MAEEDGKAGTVAGVGHGVPDPSIWPTWGVRSKGIRSFLAPHVADLNPVELGEVSDEAFVEVGGVVEGGSDLGLRRPPMRVLSTRIWASQPYQILKTIC